MSFAKTSFYYFLASFLQSAFQFLLIPIYTRVLSPGDVGVYDVLLTITMLLQTVAALGLYGAVIKLYNLDYKEHPQTFQKKIFGNTAIIVFSFTSCMVVVGTIFAPFLASVFFQDHSIVSTLYLALLLVFVTSCFEFIAVFFRAREASKKFLLLASLRIGLLFPLCFFFVVIFKLGVFGIFLGNLIAVGVTSTIFFVSIYKELDYTFNKEISLRLFQFGLPLLPASIASWVINTSDRIVLAWFVPFAEIGKYAIGYKVGSIFKILAITPLTLGWTAYSLGYLSQVGDKRKYARFFTLILFFSLIIVMAIIGGSKFVIFLMGPFSEYGMTYPLASIVAISYMFLLFHDFFTTQIHFRHKTWMLPIIVALGACANIVLNIYFIPLLGIMGAAVATLLSYALMAIATFSIAQSLYKIYFEYNLVMKLFLLAVLFCLGEWYILQNTGIFLSLFACSILVCIFSGMVVLFRIVRYKELKDFFMKIIPERLRRNP